MREDIDDEIEFTDEDIGEIFNTITKDGVYTRAEIVKVTWPACGESFLGTKRHAGGFIAGHRSYHEFVNEEDVLIQSMGGV